MRSTNLIGQDAQTALSYMRKNNIQMTAKLERQLERGVEMTMYLKNRSEMTTEEKKKIDAWLDDQMDESK